MKNEKLFINILIGFGLLTIPVFTSPDIVKGWAMFKFAPFLRNFISYFLLALFFFFSYYFVIPKFYITKQWVFLFLTGLMCYFLVLEIPKFVINNNLISGLQKAYRLPRYMHNPDFQYIRNHPILSHLISKDSHLMQFLGVFFLSALLRVNEQANKIKNEKLKADIAYLKAQINPHFLFNTLNSLYALVLTKSEDAPNAILKLSELMRYATTESSNNFVNLDKEVQIINAFIDLQKLRLTNKTKITTHFTGDFENYKVSPFILICLVENAFKYGSDTENSSEIAISLIIKNNNLNLEVKNNIVNPNIPFTTKKGISNTKTQLNLFYPNKHKLVIAKENQTYQVNLDLNLE
ncbi:sensor histidine kinase [Neotamlana laminarinivorans]|uniref:Histidine kinase n=1 Tax=Neotamlana laminarinivorans TaxID=2883124 RepID=A0A9X1HZG7_9FLAO|nr:histidine kinase [Tamlana laminarinivorans]MCB4797357.1 histidine kinase [Tamlana laminarinivorans]